jgi:hypothetical protein
MKRVLDQEERGEKKKSRLLCDTPFPLLASPQDGFCRALWSLLIDLLSAFDIFNLSRSSHSLHKWTWNYLIPNCSHGLTFSSSLCTEMFASYMERISSLKSLNLGACRRQHLLPLVHLTSLMALELGRRPLDLGYISHLTTLTHLALPELPPLSLHTVSILRGLPLQCLKMNSIRDLEELDFVCSLTNLQELFSHSSPLSEFSSIHQFSPLTNLTSLVFQANRSMWNTPSTWEALTNLTKLKFEGKILVPPDVDALTNLTDLCLVEVTIKNQTVSSMTRHLTNLTCLHLDPASGSPYDLSHSGLEDIDLLQNLHKFRLSVPELPPGIYNKLANCTKLQTLFLEYMSLQKEVLQKFSTLPDLRKLIFDSPSFFLCSGEAELFSDLTQIRELGLICCTINDAHLNLGNLEKIQLDYTHLSQDTCDSLFGLASLKTVSMIDTTDQNQRLYEFREMWKSQGIEVITSQVTSIDDEGLYDETPSY